MGTKKNFPSLAWTNPKPPKTKKKKPYSGNALRAARARWRPKVRSKRLYGRDAGIGPLTPSDLFDAPLGDASLVGNLRPLTLAFLQLIDNELMDRFSHGAECKPVFGLMQPENGGNSYLRSIPMIVGRPQKVATPKDIIGQILIDNVTARLFRAFPSASTDKDRLEALSKRSGVGKETLRKMMKGEQSPRIDTVDKVARALGTTCDALLKVSSASDIAA